MISTLTEQNTMLREEIKKYKEKQEIYKQKKSLGNSIEREMMRNFRIYMAVGGMPQAVEAYTEGKNFTEKQP